jgi:transcriptional regulator with XRE-family HTH domain
MPAKKLSPDQIAEAFALKARFKVWQAEQREKGLPASQDAVSEQLGFGQSALNQYLSGGIPLNAVTVGKFSKLLGVPQREISPIVVAEAEAKIRELQAAAGIDPEALIARSGANRESVLNITQRATRPAPNKSLDTRSKHKTSHLEPTHKKAK